MYDTTIAAKPLSQLESFLGRISPHFHKPVVRFIGDMAYGILAQKDVKLSSVVRALKEIEAAEKSSIPKRIFLYHLFNSPVGLNDFPVPPSAALTPTSFNCQRTSMSGGKTPHEEFKTPHVRKT